MLGVHSKTETDGMDSPTRHAHARTKEPQILRAAWKLFKEQGFGSTSMDAIAAEADVSKATLYAYFKSKEDLFARVVAREAEIHGGDAGAVVAVPDIGRQLATMADLFSRLILSEDNVAMYRIIMSEGRNVPELGARFYAAGPAMLIDRLAECLESAMKQGVLRTAEPRLAAAQFIGLILGELQLRMLLRVGKPPSARARSSVVRDGVAVFLRAYGAGSP